MKRLLTVLLTLLLICTMLFSVPTEAYAKTAKAKYSTSQKAKTKTKATKKKKTTKQSKAKKSKAKSKAKKKATPKKKKAAAKKKTTTVKKTVPVHNKHTLTQVKSVEPTCTKQGYITYKCKYCSNTFIQYLSAKGHKPEVVNGYPATCQKEGLTDGSKCSVCGEVLKEQEVIAKGEHSFYEEIVKATFNEEGYIARICESCGEVVYEDIPKMPPLIIALEETTFEAPSTIEAKEIQPSFTVKDSVSGRILDKDEYTYSYDYDSRISKVYGYVYVTVDNKYWYGTQYVGFTVNIQQSQPLPRILRLSETEQGVTITFDTKIGVASRYTVQCSTDTNWNNYNVYSWSVRAFPINNISTVTATLGLPEKYADAHTLYFRVQGEGGATSWSETKILHLT